MGKLDWDISGPDYYLIKKIEDSWRCVIYGKMLFLWNGRNDLRDSQIILERKHSASRRESAGGMVLRANASGDTAYRFRMCGDRRCYIEKVVNGVVTTLNYEETEQPWDEYVKYRFRVDGFQLSVHEWVSGEWQLLMFVDDLTQAITQGYAGFFGDNDNTSYRMYFDNVEIRER